MQAVITTEEDFTLVSIKEKRLDAANAPQLRQSVAELVASGAQRIVLDISAVEFMDSSSLGTMVGILKMVGGKGELVVAGARGIVADLFRLTRMDRVFRMTASVDEAGRLMAAA